MPNKPLVGFGTRTNVSRRRTGKQRVAKSNAALADERLKNLAKARRVKKQLALKKKKGKVKK